MNLLQIDELVRSQHYWLDPGDLCYYFMEYTSYAGFRFNEANDLIQNFKKPMDRQGMPEWSYKQQAILRIRKILIESIPSKTDLSHILFVPIPPSRRKTDELYDDRIVQVLSAFCKTYRGDLREILSMKDNIEASHTIAQRPKRSVYCSASGRKRKISNDQTGHRAVKSRGRYKIAGAGRSVQ